MPEMISIFDFLRDPPPPRLVPVRIPESLAVEVARLLAERFPDHECFIGAPSVDPTAPSAGAPPGRSSPEPELEARPERRPANAPQTFLAAWIVDDTEFPFVPCRGADLYEAYTFWAIDQRASPVGRRQFTAVVEAEPGWHRRAKLAGEEGRVRMVLPNPDAAPEGFALQRQFGENETEYLGRCVDLFARTLASVCEA